MKLVVLQCADHFALKRGWKQPDPHNVITLPVKADTLGGTWGDDVPEEHADEASVGG